MKNSICVISDSGTAAEEGLFYSVPNVTLRKTTERYETLESGATIVSGLVPENVIQAIQTAISTEWSISYNFEEDFSPSNVVINALRSKITNFF